MIRVKTRKMMAMMMSKTSVMAMVMMTSMMILVMITMTLMMTLTIMMANTTVASLASHLLSNEKVFYSLTNAKSANVAKRNFIMTRDRRSRILQT